MLAPSRRSQLRAVLVIFVLALGGLASIATSPLIVCGDGVTRSGEFCYEGAINFPAGVTPSALGLADFDFDGDVDIAVAGQGDNAVQLLLNEGIDFFFEGAFVQVGQAPSALTVADLDQNDTPDLLVTNQLSSDITVILNDGFGGLSALSPIPVGQSPADVRLADFNF